MSTATNSKSLSKICNPNDQSVNPPLLEMWEIALPTPLRIDAPESPFPTHFAPQHLRVEALSASSVPPSH